MELGSKFNFFFCISFSFNGDCILIHNFLQSCVVNQVRTCLNKFHLHLGSCHKGSALCDIIDTRKDFFYLLVLRSTDQIENFCVRLNNVRREAACICDRVVNSCLLDDMLS